MNSVNRRSIQLLLIPIGLFFIIFYLYPLFSMMSKSFFLDGDFSFGEYKSIFETQLYIKVFIKTLKIAVIVTMLAILIGYPLAYFITYANNKIILFGIVAISMWLGVIIRSYGWITILGKHGLINYLLSFLDISKDTMLYNQMAVIIGMVHILLPYMILPLYTVMATIPRNILNSSLSLGASNFSTFVKVFFPLSVPGILAGSLLVFIQSIGFYITPALIGGREDAMIAQLIDIQVNELLNWPFASALATILLIVTMGILFISSKFVPLDILWGGKK